MTDPTTPSADQLREEATRLRLMAESYRNAGGTADSSLCIRTATAKPIVSMTIREIFFPEFFIPYLDAPYI
jgi:hypothetical protein